MHHHFTDTAYRANELMKIEKLNKDARIYNNVKVVITNEKFCQDRHFDILIYVFSAAGNFDERLAIRATWGNKTVLKDDVKHVYIIGRASSVEKQKLLEKESEKFNDIVQGDFEDSYVGLGNKSITTWNWIRMYCHTAKVFMKADDDLALDIERILTSVNPYINKPRHLMCYLINNAYVKREKENKYYVSFDEYPDKFYHSYCNGWAFLYTTDIVQEMCQYMLWTEMFKIADVWTTGMVMKKVQNLTRINIENLLGLTAGQSQSWGFTSRSTARVMLGQVLRIATCGTRTHRGGVDGRTQNYHSVSLHHQ